MSEDGHSSAGAEIQAVGRAAQILAMLSNEQPLLTVAGVAEALNLKRPTAYRYLNSLTAVRLLARDETSQGFAPGDLAVQLGALALGKRQVLDRATPHMRRVAVALRMSVVLTLWGPVGPVVVRVYEDVSRLAITTVPVGSQLPLDSAQGVLFLAYSGQLDVARLKVTLPQERRDAMESQVGEAKKRGSAMRDYEDGTTCIAAPVFNVTDICATLAVVCATLHISRSTEAQELLCQAADELSKELGGEAFVTAGDGSGPRLPPVAPPATGDDV